MAWCRAASVALQALLVWSCLQFHWNMPVAARIGTVTIPGKATALRLENESALIVELRQGFPHSALQLQRASPLRRNLREARMWLYGHVLSQGYYYANVWLGTPPQQFALIVDTGSTVTYVPCASCTQCGKHQDLPFDPSNSSSYSEVRCAADNCLGHSCDAAGRCSYARHYAEDSSSGGLIASDLVTFGKESSIAPTRILFGCELRETGDLFTQRADGIVGLGRGPLSIVNQLSAAHAMEEQFSLCYGGIDAGGGAMVLGTTAVPPEMAFTPLDPRASTYYNVQVEGITVAGERLRFNAEAFEGGYGAVFDSGTTFAYLPAPVFDAFHKQVAAAAASTGLSPVDGPDPNYKDICFQGAADNAEELPRFFPSASFLFSGGVEYKLAPENYLFRHSKVVGAYCLGFFKNADGGALLGGILVRNTLVTYDRVRGRIGLWKTDCSRVFEALHTLEGGGAGGGGGADVPPLPADLVAEPPPLRDTNAPAFLPPQPQQPTGEGEGGGTATPEQPGPAVGAANASCRICASAIELQLTIKMPPSDFADAEGELREDIARELGFQEEQVSVVAFGPAAAPPLGRLTQANVSIAPLAPAATLEDADVERVHRLLDGGVLLARDKFGPVVVERISTVALGATVSGLQQAGWLVGVVLLALVLAALLLFLWALVARHRRLARQHAWAEGQQKADEEVGLAKSEGGGAEEEGEGVNLVREQTEMQALPRESVDHGHL